MVAGTRRAGFRSRFVVACRLRLACYVVNALPVVAPGAVAFVVVVSLHAMAE